VGLTKRWRVSGRWFTGVTLTLCALLAGFALWQRSRDTARIREFWGPGVATLIQNAPQVELRLEDSMNPDDARQNASTWSDFSRAPGLVHLRATLVDDRYYQWPARLATTEQLGRPNNRRCVLRFSSDTRSAELSIQLETGWITALATGKQAQLIPASQQAIAAYLEIEAHHNVSPFHGHATATGDATQP